MFGVLTLIWIFSPCLLHCARLGCIRSCIKDTSYEFLRKSLGVCLIDWSSRVIGLKGFELICFIFFVFLWFSFCLLWTYDFCLFTWYISIICNISSLWTGEIYYIYKAWCGLILRQLLITIDVYWFLIIKCLYIVEFQP